MIAAVSGATGFVGQAVLSELLEKGHSARPLVRVASGLPDEIVTGDLENARLDPAQLRGTDVVIHLASRVPTPGESDAEAEASFQAVNVQGTDHLLTAALNAGVRRFVFMSSVKAMAERSFANRPLDVDDILLPEDAYGRSKADAEALVRSRCEQAGAEWTIIRPPMVFGPGMRGNFGTLARLVESGIPLPLASIRNRRSIVYVVNLASAVVHCCEAPGAADKILLIADNHLSTPALIRAVASGLNKPPRMVPFPPRLLATAAQLARRPGLGDRLLGYLEINSDPSLDALGWRPPVALEDAMASSLRRLS
jgi:nucleoside-diphosphate-sugar epimerase